MIATAKSKYNGKTLTEKNINSIRIKLVFDKMQQSQKYCLHLVIYRDAPPCGGFFSADDEVGKKSPAPGGNRTEPTASLDL